MTPGNIGRIRPLTPEEQQERIRQRDAEQQEHGKQTEAEMLADLDAYEFRTGRETGRPRIKLPAVIARRILEDVEAGASQKAIVAKYRKYYRFSPKWLRNSLTNGRLQQMADGEPVRRIEA